jgi:hypothetical protein
MVDIETGGQESRVNLLKQLKEGSEFLETQKEDLSRIWKEFQGKIVSFYEIVKTPTVQKVTRKTLYLVRFYIKLP